MTLTPQVKIEQRALGNKRTAVRWLVAFLLLAATGAIAQQGLGFFTNDCRGNRVVRWTNAPACFVVEGTTNLEDWVRLLKVSAWDNQEWIDFEYLVPRDEPMTFYRLKQSLCCTN